jgi:autotransporter-associated beta strand protein
MIPTWLRQWRKNPLTFKQQVQHSEEGHLLRLEELENRTLPSFVFSGTVATANSPTSVIAADLNGDGLVDLAVANMASSLSQSTVTVLMGKGDGTFEAPRNYLVGGYGATGFALADINGDGVPDLVLVNQFSNNLSILLGNGDGTFKTAQTFPTSAQPTSLAVADVNGDGKPDVLIGYGAYPGGRQITILPNTSTGGTISFGTPITLTLSTRETRFTTADVNGDGKPDLILLYGSYNSVGVMLGNGNGTFQTAQVFPVGKYPTSVAVADLNGDGKAELVTSNYNDNSVSILFGNGNGTFQAAQNLFAGPNPSRVAVVDVNDIGFPSLVVTNEKANTVSILFGPGNGTFEAPSSVSVGGSYPVALAVADLNGDGQPDLVTANSRSGNISVLLNNSATPFQPIQNFPAYGIPVSVAVGDLNGDGLKDVVAVASNGSNDLSVFLGTGTGAFPVTRNIPVRYATSVAIGDVNGDGIPDLIVACERSNTVSVLLGNGDGTFKPAVNTSVYHPVSVATADVNGDGKLDLIVGSARGIFPSTFEDVIVFLGNGDGTFTASQTVTHTSVGTSVVAAADLNGDGRPDLVVLYPGTVSVLYGNGNGTFQSPQSIFSGLGTNLSSLTITDLNGDKNPDLVFLDKSRVGLGPVQSRVDVLLGNGNGTFRLRTTSLAFPPSAAAVADMNGDGRPDLVVTYNYTADKLSVFLGNGDGSFENPETVNGGPLPFTLAISDVNGDGRPDIVVADANGSSIGVLLRTVATQFQVVPATLGIAGKPVFVTVTAKDPSNRVDCRFTGTISFSSSDPLFVPPAPYTFTLTDQGQHTFAVTLDTAGLQTITINDGRHSATSTTLILPAAPTHLVFPLPPLGSVVGTPLPQFTVQLLDPFNNLTTSTANVSLMIASGPGSFTTGSQTTVAAVNGVATFSNIVFTAAGTYKITASSAGLSSITSTSFPISVATKRTWTGKGPDNLWTDPTNWLENVAPTAGDDLFFPDGALQTATSTNNLAGGFSVHSINFSGVAGGYDLLGNGIMLSAGITGNAGLDKVDLAGITLGASQTFQAANASLAISSALALNGFTLTLDGGLSPTGNDALTGIISGGGGTAGAIIKNGPSLWLVSGNNTFTGATTINLGTLAVNNSNSLGSTANTVTVNSGSSGSGSMQVFNNISVLQSLVINGNGNNTSAGAIDIKDITGNDTFGAISLGSAASILSANIGVNTMTLTGAIQNNGSDLSVVGAGGYTTILSSSASISGMGHVLNFGSIFSGTGTLNSVLNVNQGTLSPGSGGNPGTLNSSDVNFGIGTNFNPTLGNFNSSLPNNGTSLLNSTGSVNLSGSNLSLSFQNGFVPDPTKSYVIIEATGSINGNFNGLPDGAPITVNGQHFLIRYVNSSAGTLQPGAASGRIVIYPQPAATTTSLFASSNPVSAGQQETFTAIVTSPAAAVAGVSSSDITGTVNFLDGGSIIGSRQVTGGAAVFTTSSLMGGNHSITATYTGSPSFSPSYSTDNNVPPISLVVISNTVGWQDVMTGNFTTGKDSDIAGMTAGGSWWVAISNGSSFNNQFWGSWPGPAFSFVDVQTGDFNGDGLTDIAGRNSQNGQWYVAQSTGSSFNTTVWTTWNPNVAWTDVIVGDFNGDGKSDIAGRFPQTGQWFVAQSTGSSFVSSLWATWNPNVTWVDVNVGNFAGNKTSDITGRWLQGGSWWTAVSNGSSFTTSLWAQWNPTVTWVDVKVGDFNGDGKSDITARYSQTGQWWTAISTGSSFNTTLWATWNPNLDWVDVKVGDFNGDGKGDITARWLDTGEWFTGLSTGSGFLTSMWDAWSPAVTWVDVNVGDVNGDGVPDLVGRIQQNGQWWAALSNGSTAFTNQLWTTWAV